MNKTAKEIILQYVIDSGSEQCFIDNLLTTQDICIRDIIGTLYDIMYTEIEKRDSIQSPHIDLPVNLRENTLIKVKHNLEDNWDVRYFQMFHKNQVLCYVDGLGNNSTKYHYPTVAWEYATMLTPDDIVSITFSKEDQYV